MAAHNHGAATDCTTCGVDGIPDKCAIAKCLRQAPHPAHDHEPLLHNETCDDIDMTWNDQQGFVYVAMSSDIVHHGHINILKHAAKLGKVVVGLMTDASIESYKRVPIIPYQQRKRVVEEFRSVFKVIPQTSVDYVPNVRLLKAAWVVHGTDWRTGPQAKSRQVS
jgi:cytidyltransferase-like protein